MTNLNTEGQPIADFFNLKNRHEVSMNIDEIRDLLVGKSGKCSVARLRKTCIAALDEIDRLEKTTVSEDYHIATSKSIAISVEQRTKEACFKAGWEWIIKRIPMKYMPNEDEGLFKQAIDSAEVT